jgi:hypothetical protein
MAIVFLINNRNDRTIAVALSYDAAIAWLKTPEGKAALQVRGVHIVQATTTDHDGHDEWKQAIE